LIIWIEEIIITAGHCLNELNSRREFNKKKEMKHQEKFE